MKLYTIFLIFCHFILDCTCGVQPQPPPTTIVPPTTFPPTLPPTTTIVPPTTFPPPTTIAPTTTTTKPPPGLKCGYNSCNVPKDGFINVHIVPHTHDDVGWLKTLDQYFYGSKTKIQKAGVEYILDSVVAALKKNPDRKFIYVETAYFWKWWIKQHDFVKSQVRNFVNNGQLEFIGGGWVMNDEATTHYQSTIDQFTWGLRKLEESFGVCGIPRAIWQVDPFGHSRELASIFSQLGFDGLLLGRIDYQDKDYRFSQKLPEGVWKVSESLNNELFTSVMYNNYAPPPGFCFDVLCDDEPIIDDKKSTEYNVDKKIAAFFEYVHNMTKVYSTENVLITMGEDFNYQNAEMWYKNLDKLILHANELQTNGSKYNLFYSTPSCYIKAVSDAGAKQKIQWPVKKDDFFPYASDPHSFWTGYFTSRPTLKRFERVGNNFLQVCKQLYSMTNLGPEDWADLNVLREAMGVMQHHDAITGTEKQQVAFDYARLLTKGIDECEFVAATALSNIVTNKTKSDELQTDPTPDIPFQSCLLANMSQCDITEQSKTFIVTVYNPLSRPVSHYARFPVTGNSYKITGPDGQDVPNQIIPIPDFIKNVPGRNSKAVNDLVFYAENIPALGFKSYYVQLVKKYGRVAPDNLQKITQNNINIAVNQSTGLLTIYMNNLPFTQEFLYYESMVGNNEEAKNRSSGAYIFRPKDKEAKLVADKVKTEVYKGELVIEVHQKYSDWINQITRLYHKENFVEFDWTVGPIPITDNIGKEVISRFKSKLNSTSLFYTDSNGRETMKRMRNFRPTWKLNLEEPVSGNYYPVTSKILIRDQQMDYELAVLTDRAQGGSSMRDGEMELMIHRRCLHDDAFGVGEALNETAFGKGLVARGSHYVLGGKYLQNDIEIQFDEKDVAQRKLLSVWTFFSPTQNLAFNDYKAKYNMEYGGLTKNLPKNVQILTLEPWKKADLLLRLEHVYEKSDNPVLSNPAKIDLKELFNAFQIKSVTEMSLGANQPLKKASDLPFSACESLEDVLDRNLIEFTDFRNKTQVDNFVQYERMKFIWKNNQRDSNYIGTFTPSLEESQDDVQDDFTIILNPMQIRTFILEVSMN